jgi:acyl carrier protein
MIAFDDVAKRAAAVLRVPADSLTSETTLADLPADSFLLVEMIVDLQEEFGAAFTQARLREVTNLGELTVLLDETSLPSGPPKPPEPPEPPEPPG